MECDHQTVGHSVCVAKFWWMRIGRYSQISNVYSKSLTFREIVRPPGVGKIAWTEVQANINPTYSKHSNLAKPYYSCLLLLYHRNALDVSFDRKVILTREIWIARKGSTPSFEGGAYTIEPYRIIGMLSTGLEPGIIRTNIGHIYNVRYYQGSDMIWIFKFGVRP